jgi:hypothetical protein
MNPPGNPMRATTAVSLALLLLAAAAADDKKFVSKDGKYAVAFPGEPKTDSKSTGELTTQTAVVEAKGVSFWVISTALPADTVKSFKPEEILENGEKGLMKNFRGKASESKATTFGKDKYPAREAKAEVTLDGKTLNLRLQLVFANGRMYQVLAIGSKDAVAGAASDAFFQSFEVTK